MPCGWGMGFGGGVEERKVPKVGRPHRDRGKVKAGRRAARR